LDISQKILSEITVYMKYARYLSSAQRRETWEEMITRNRDMHIENFPKLTGEIENAYKLVYEKKVLPSMRSLQFAGPAIKQTPSRIYNCAYLPIDDYQAFSEVMFLLLGGTGVGYSVQKHHVDKLPSITIPTKRRRYLVGDSIEGWSDCIKMLMKAYFCGRPEPEFDFSGVRPKGALLITSGGKAPGPEPLKDCIHNIKRILDRKENGDQLSTLEVHDIVCWIADAVLSGGIRRSATISLFSIDDQEMLQCKFGDWWETEPQRSRANNSAVVVRHRVKKKDFFAIWEKVKESGAGEPGVYFTNDSEWGTNPCAEIALRPFQFCNLCEVNVSDVETQQELNDRVVAATLIGTLQTAYTNFHYLRDVWRRTTEKDALLGVGMTGIGSGRIQRLDLESASKLAVETNKYYAAEIGVKQSARITTVKPSGTTSCVLGTSSGVHAWHNDYYIRRVRVGKNEAIYTYLTIHHPELVEDDFFKPESQAVISIPQRAPNDGILRHETSLELLERVKDIYNRWIVPGHRTGNNTHNVSCTVSVRDEEWEEVGKWMWQNREYYNGIAVLPYFGGNYKQAPFEDIDEKTFEGMFIKLKEVDLSNVVEVIDNTNLTGELACAGASCEIT
jgi:ribonucleoside-triphosphate reductase (thioredoxin)